MAKYTFADYAVEHQVGVTVHYEGVLSNVYQVLINHACCGVTARRLEERIDRLEYLLNDDPYDRVYDPPRYQIQEWMSEEEKQFLQDLQSKSDKIWDERLANARAQLDKYYHWVNHPAEGGIACRIDDLYEVVNVEPLEGGPRSFADMLRMAADKE